MIQEHPTIRIKLANTERMEGENPNAYTKAKMDALRASFKTYGKIVDQIIVDDGQTEPDLAEHLCGRYLIINGEHSLQVLQENGVEETDVKMVRCKDDVDIFALVALDNHKIAYLTEEETPLTIHLRLREYTYDNKEGRYFDDLTLERLIKKLETEEGHTSPIINHKKQQTP